MRLFRIHSESRTRTGHSFGAAFCLSGSLPAAAGTLSGQPVPGFCDAPHSPWFEVLWILIWILTIAIAVAGSHLYDRYKETQGEKKRKEAETNHLNYKKKNV